MHQCDKFAHNPRGSHADAVKRTCRCLFGTPGQLFTLNHNSDMKLECYVDEYFAGLWKHLYDRYSMCVNIINLTIHKLRRTYRHNSTKVYW